MQRSFKAILLSQKQQLINSLDRRYKELVLDDKTHGIIEKAIQYLDRAAAKLPDDDRKKVIICGKQTEADVQKYTARERYLKRKMEADEAIMSK